MGENAARANNFGLPSLFNRGLGLRIVCEGHTGVVTDFDEGALAYVSPQAEVTSLFKTRCITEWTKLANRTCWLRQHSDLNNFFGATQTNGNSTITAKMLAAGYTATLRKDLLGVNINPDFLLVDIETNNTIDQPAAAPAACGFDAEKTCVTHLINSDGSPDLLAVPEPGMLSLLGIAIAGLGFVGGRKSAV